MFSHPEIVQLLKTEFIPYAGDQWYLHRQKDEAGTYFWKVVQQGYRRNAPEDDTRQGVYAASADGVCLGSLNHPSPERNLTMLQNALQQFRDQQTKGGAVNASAQSDARYARTPPVGGIVLDVFTRIPLPPPAGKAWTPNQATGRDHLWLTKEEVQSLLPSEWKKGLRYPVPPAIAERIIRFHLLDNVRGEPDVWMRDHIKAAELTLTVEDAATGTLRLEGMAQMERPRRQGAQGYEARLQGTVRFDRTAQRFTRMDILAWGEAWGEGTYTRGAPPGRFPLVFAFSLAGSRPADQIPPQASRNLGEYFTTGHH